MKKHKPVNNLNQLLQVVGISEKEGLKEVSVSEAHVENLTKNGDKYTITQEGTPVKIEWQLSLEPNKLYFVEIPERQAGSVIKSKVLVDGLSYPYENRFRENQLWVVGNGNINKTLKFTIDEGKAKEWDLRGFKFYSIDIPTLTNTLEQFKKST